MLHAGEVRCEAEKDEKEVGKTGDSSDQTYAAKHYYAALCDLREEAELVPAEEPEKEEGGQQDNEPVAEDNGEQKFNIWLVGDDICRIEAQSCLQEIRDLSDGACIMDLPVLIHEIKRISEECAKKGRKAVFELANP